MVQRLTVGMVMLSLVFLLAPSVPSAVESRVTETKREGSSSSSISFFSLSVAEAAGGEIERMQGRVPLNPGLGFYVLLTAVIAIVGSYVLHRRREGMEEDL